MKNLSFAILFLVALNLSAQFNCIDGSVYTCNGFVDTETIYGNVQNSNNSITTYTCNGVEIGSGLGNGSNDNFGQDDIYIFNSIGESGAFNSMDVTLYMDPNSDLDIIAITSDCTYECFNSNSYVLNGTGISETITLNWEDEQTIILVVEAYHLDGGGEYYLEFDYNTNFNYCSYFPNFGEELDCSTGNTFSGSIIIPNCTTSIPQNCPPSMTYHEGKGPYFGYEQVYELTPTEFSGTITVELIASPGVEVFLYHRQYFGIDNTPTLLLGSSTGFLSVNYSMVSDFDEFFLLIDSPNQGTYPFTFTINYPGCYSSDPCGECFTYTEIGDNKCKIDNSLIPDCGAEEWYYIPYNGGSSVDFQLGTDNEVQFPIAGDYIVCNTHYCNDSNPTKNTSASTTSSTCCIIVSVGEPCNDAPIAHFTGSPNIQGSNIGHVNFFNSSTSLNADYYSWHWGDGLSDNTTQTSISHDYPLEPNPLTLCMVASNECGMSKYCISYDTYGAGIFTFDCGLPFNPYEPPPIYPTFDGANLSITDISFACGAEEITFDPGDGTGEYAVSCNGINYTYNDDGNYVCCIRIRFSCYTICFCYTVNAGGFNCNTDPFILECNDTGDLSWEDSTNPSNHNGISKLSNVVDQHFNCTSTNDGCDESNTLSPNVPFNRNEIVYVITNPASNHLGDITIDLIMKQNNLDLDAFIYSACDGNGNFSGCVASSTHHNNNPSGKRDAILLTNVPSFDKFYVVVDGQSNASTINEGDFLISYTCGNLCEKYTQSIQCGQTIEGSTLNAQNNASYYCNCDNESEFGPAGNYGPENIYRLDIQQTSTVSIDLELTTPNIDLELYLLNGCKSTLCNRNSRNGTNQNENITKLLTAGTYFVIIEGFAGDRGDYELTVSGCESSPVPSNDCELLSTYDFEGYNDSDLIPTNDNSGKWDYGICYEEDLNDNMLDAVIEELDNNKRMVLNSGNYFYSDVALNYEIATSGIRKLEWDLTPQYVDDELFGGKIKLYDQSVLLDYSEMLEIKYGHDSNGNFAELWYTSFGLVGNQEIKLADITSMINYTGNDPFPVFKFDYVYNLNSNQFTLRVNGLAIYSGIFNYLSQNFLVGRTINFAVDDDQDYMEIDNIKVYECEDCDISYDDDCNSIFITYLNQNDQGSISVDLDQSGIDVSSIEGFEVHDEDTGQIIPLESLSYNNCIPGKSYKFCILYRDEEGCLKACCYRITIPLNCLYFLPYYSGNEDELAYSFETENIPSGFDLEQWHIDGQILTGSNSVQVDYEAPQNSFVCLLVYDPFSKQHILCCFTLCVDFAIGCGNINATYDNSAGTYNLSVIGAQEVLSWNIDSPSNLPNNGKITSPDNFNPSDYGISPGQTILVSVRYVDTNECIKVCCIELSIPIPQDAVIFDINDACGEVGSTVEVPVTLLNFNDVGIVGFEIFSADNAKVRLEGLTNKAPQFSSLDFNVVNNKIILGWDDPQGGNISVPDGTKMFDIEVTILQDFNDPVMIFGAQLEVLGNNVLDASINSGNVCISNEANIFGEISTYNQNPLENVEVNLSGTTSASTSTNESGAYGFENISGGPITIRPYNNADIRQGVSISDVALIRKHYLQVSQLDNDYKLIAADVNKSGSISNTDVALARRIYLQVITDEIPNNTSWRFVPIDEDISDDPLNVNLADKLTIPNPMGNVAGQDFVGIKVADVNNSVGLKNGKTPESARSNPLRFIVDDIMVQAGQTVNIPVRVEDFENIALFGFEIIWDEQIMNMVEITSDLEGFTGQNYNILDGKAIIGWDEPNGGAVSLSDTILLNLLFEIDESAIGTTNLDFGSPEVLDADFAEVNTEFVSGDITVETNSIDPSIEGKILVYPNPFLNVMTIDVSAIGGGTSLEITDMDGRLVWKSIGSQNMQIQLREREIPQPGVYILRIYNDSEEYVKRIIKI